MVWKFTTLKQKFLKFQWAQYDWSVDNTKRTGFTGYVYDSTVDYDPTTVDDIKY